MSFGIFFFFLPYRVTCRILVPQPRTEPGTTSVKVPSLNHWATRDGPSFEFFHQIGVKSIESEHTQSGFEFSLSW